MVSWTGADSTGSGIAGYDIYASDDDAPFSLWLNGVQSTSATFSGQEGHHYAFYAVATDNVGHRQTIPAAAQAATLVPAGSVTAKLIAPAPPAYAGRRSRSA